MARRGRPPKHRGLTIRSEESRIVLGMVAVVVAALVLSSLFISATGLDVINRYIGFGALFLSVATLLLGLRLFGHSSILTETRALVGWGILTVVATAFAHFWVPIETAAERAQEGNGGGIIGYRIDDFLVDMFSRFGAMLVLLIGLTLALVLIAKLSPGSIIDGVARFFAGGANLSKRVLAAYAERRERKKAEKKEAEEEKAEKEKVEEEGEVQEGGEYVGTLSGKTQLRPNGSAIEEDETKKEKPGSGEEGTEEPVSKEEFISARSRTADDKVGEGSDDTAGTSLFGRQLYEGWKYPPIDLLNPVEEVKREPKDQEKNTEIIEKTLRSFGIQAKVVEVAEGPTVVQYAMSITMGTKVSKIKSLQGDLALALAAPSGTVRVEAPIPGTSLVGIEMPHERPQLVTMREIMESKEMQSNKMGLALAIGKDVTGKIIVRDLARMPHLLVAGATGAGKSVAMSAFVISLLMKKSPDELRFILIDPKMVEMSVYNGIPHLLTPVIVDTEKAVNSFKWAVSEMKRRYTLFKNAKVRNLEDYNKLMGFPAVPYIIIAIDELADLMLSGGIEVETLIVRLAQLARATGIHLVLATQRPSVDVLTGLIKANIPARIGMNVATSVDSRVILDMIGAESLLGNGDMLFKPPDIGRPYRIQGAWCSMEEIEKVVGFVKEQTDAVKYSDEVIESKESGEFMAKPGEVTISEDDLFTDAVRTIIHSRKASASLLQRRLRIGYNRAARLLDELYELGAVGPADGSKPRDVLISDADAFLRKLQGEGPGS